jgi:smad nuclear-interacting protein 1
MDAGSAVKGRESEGRHRRSRSCSHDSEDERRRRRRRREREERGEHKDRHSRGHKDEREDSEKRDRDRDVDRKRRRSRSPVEDSSHRKHRDRDSKRDADDGYSHYSRRDRNRGDRDQDRKARDDEIDKQVSRKKSGPLPSQEASFSMTKSGSSTALIPGDDRPIPEKQKPNFAPTGLLAAASNTVAQADGTSIVLKYHEPPEARKPPSRDQWKFFVFKGADIVDTIELGVRSCWLVGRELSVVDLAAEHPSISKQHAVVQFRYIEKKNEYGDKIGKVKPYLIDLESANGTMVNKELVPTSRYWELRDKDMIQFGDSTREYVLMLPPRD